MAQDISQQELALLDKFLKKLFGTYIYGRTEYKSVDELTKRTKYASPYKSGEFLVSRETISSEQLLKIAAHCSKVKLLFFIRRGGQLVFTRKVKINEEIE